MDTAEHFVREMRPQCEFIFFAGGPQCLVWLSLHGWKPSPPTPWPPSAATTICPRCAKCHGQPAFLQTLCSHSTALHFGKGFGLVCVKPSSKCTIHAAMSTPHPPLRKGAIAVVWDAASPPVWDGRVCPLVLLQSPGRAQHRPHVRHQCPSGHTFITPEPTRPGAAQNSMNPPPPLKERVNTAFCRRTTPPPSSLCSLSLSLSLSAQISPPLSPSNPSCSPTPSPPHTPHHSQPPPPHGVLPVRRPQTSLSKAPPPPPNAPHIFSLIWAQPKKVTKRKQEWEKKQKTGSDMPLASGRETGYQWQSAPHQRPLSNTRPPAPPELSRNALRPVCGSVGPCSIELADASGKSGQQKMETKCILGCCFLHSKIKGRELRL